jgi:acetone carboxylase beta subunit
MADKVEIIASDAGGTMTDMIVVDSEGSFSIGKAATTPHDQSLGFFESLSDAFSYWGVDFDNEAGKILPGVDAVVYAGTAMLNALLTDTGRKIGVITQRGDEDVFLHERSRQTWAGYSYQDVLHHVTHHHNHPLVSRRMTKGVTGRINMFGFEAIPLYEDDVRQAVAELLDEGAEGIAVCLWFSYMNPAHELRAGEIVAEIMKQRGVDLPIYLSHKIAPIMREQSRLNTVALHALAVDPGREQLFKIETMLKGKGYAHPLQIVLSHGGVANIRYPRLHEACFSGPIGGLLGARYLAHTLDMGNWVCSDMGGTSFDVGLIRHGEPIMDREVVITRRLFNIPTLVMDSIGAGTGMYVTIDPITRRITLGPDSAGADPGPVCYNMGNETPTVMDCCLIMGILNPDNYLGGKMKLDKQHALDRIKATCSDVLGVDPYYLAEGVYKLINSAMKEHIRMVLLTRGYSPADYCLLNYGGAGPMHLAGYSEGMPFKGVATVPWAAAFSSFGAACVDLGHRYQKSTGALIPYGADDGWKMMMAGIINAGWDELEKEAAADLVAEGLPWDKAKLQSIAYICYRGQMEDIEVPSPTARLNSPKDVDDLIAEFERIYEKVYAGVAKHERAGYQITELGLTVTVPKIKPKLVKRPLESKTPPQEAVKGEREVYIDGKWQRAAIYDMDKLRPGNEIDGAAVVEAPATTFFIPPVRHVRMDEWSILWLT